MAGGFHQLIRCHN